MQHTDLALLGQPSPTPPGNLVPVPAWREALRHAIRDPRILEQRLRLPPGSVAIDPDFPLLIPESFLARMQPGQPTDPLLLQVLPTPLEQSRVDGFVPDPVGDLDSRRAPGFLHKYHGRALLITTGACAVHCRYCFRRHYPYEEDARQNHGLEEALAEIEQDLSLREIILSGGDPLMRSDPWLAHLARRLADMPQLSVLRIHTRLPIVLPERVDDALMHWLGETRLQKVIVVHSNHPSELTGDVPQALARLRDTGAMLLNQAVLLAGINDDAAVLESLSRRLLTLGVLPYYLHQLDRVAGSAHFEVPECRGRELMRELRARLPGYLVPRYVREVAGDLHKVPIEEIRLE